MKQNSAYSRLKSMIPLRLRVLLRPIVSRLWERRATLAIWFIKEKHASCPTCGEKATLFRRTFMKYLLFRCASCTHVFAKNLPSAEEIRRFYKGFDYFIQDRVHQGIDSLTEEAQWTGWLSKRLDSIALFDGLATRGKGDAAALDILEVGCSEGKLLQRLKSLGHRVVGCDINAGLVESSSAVLGVEIIPKALEDCGFREESFDLVISYHTFEHLVDPRRTLERCRDLLRPGGKAIIEVPIGAEEFENPHHFHHFTAESAREMFERVFGNATVKKDGYVTGNGVPIESVFAGAVKEIGNAAKEGATRAG
jgi:SAM-dependent methyltransferase